MPLLPHKHICRIYDVEVITEIHYKITCVECGIEKYFNTETNEFYNDKIYPKGDEAEYTIVTQKEFE